MEDVITLQCSGFQGKLPASAARSLIDDVTAPEPPQLDDPSASTVAKSHTVPIGTLTVALAVAS
jgi:hypothetical protein